MATSRVRAVLVFAFAGTVVLCAFATPTTRKLHVLSLAALVCTFLFCSQACVSRHVKVKACIIPSAMHHPLCRTLFLGI